MNTDNNRQIRAWLEARDPGTSPARLRAAVAEVPYARRGPRLPGLDYVRVRVLGVSMTVRPLAVLVAVLALVAAIVGAGLVWRWLQFPPRGLIAFTVPLEQAGSTGIRLIAADGTRERQITAATPNLFEHSPRWSPDGRTLLFARNSELDPFGSCPGVGSVVLYDVATATERVIATNLRPIDTVEWSPSGDRVAYLWPPPGCGAPAELGVVDVATGAVTLTPLGDGIFTLRWEGDSATAVSLSAVDGLPVEVLPVDVPSNDGRFVARVTGPGRRLTDSLEVQERGAGTPVNLGAGGAPAWSPDGSSVAFIQFTASPSEYGLNFRDRLAIASTGTWQVRAVADVMVLEEPGNPSLVRLPPLAWTRDGRAIYWLDMTGGHVVEVATGRSVDLPAALNGCDDLQWQPTPAED